MIRLLVVRSLKLEVPYFSLKSFWKRILVIEYIN